MTYILSQITKGKEKKENSYRVYLIDSIPLGVETREGAPKIINVSN